MKEEQKAIQKRKKEDFEAKEEKDRALTPFVVEE